MLHASALDGQMADLFSQVGVAVFYLVVWGLVFAGTGLFVGAFIPFITGDSLLFASGLVTAATPELSVWILALGVGIAAFIGDQVGFILGRHLGRPYLDRKSGPRMKKIIARVEKFYNSYGWWSVVIARFIPWARVFVPWVAGIGKMNYFKFLTSNFVGALAWGVGLTLVGYYAASIPGVKAAAYVIAGFFITASIIFSIRTWILERRDRQQNPAN
ncbi:DedA family protein [uncultured Aurantimicrobium sp.]|uniref:DedA family protein n=1 Tax=uncultured Aurantimicrobium sp. TaxID=1705357 RepID=UPI00260C7FE5|nr:DedA family protein [uncultured Aurantimicrobium sp.]